MKANGNNWKMFMYQTHDYMDMRPETSFRATESQEAMNQFIEHTRTHWCSGTVSKGTEVSPIEYFNARQSRYWRGCEEKLDKLAENCSREWLDEYSFYVKHSDMDPTALKREYDSMILEKEAMTELENFCAEMNIGLHEFNLTLQWEDIKYNFLVPQWEEEDKYWDEALEMYWSPDCFNNGIFVGPQNW